MLTFQQLFKIKGVRKPNQLLNPTIIGFHEFEFPKNPIYHWIPDDDRLAPTKDDLDNFESIKHIYVDYVRSLSTSIGNPHFQENHFNEKVRQFHASNKDVHWLKKEPNLVTDVNTLIVESYAALHYQYKYQSILRSIGDSFYNRFSTLFNRVNTLADTERHQFLRLSLGDTIPLRVKFEEAEDCPLSELSQSLMKIFSTDANLFLLEMWKWVSYKPSLLDRVKSNNLQYFNVILHYKNKSVWLNLEVLDQWRVKDPKTKAEQDDDINIKGLEPKRFQLSLLKLLISIMTEPKVKIDKVRVKSDGMAAFKALQTDPESEDDVLLKVEDETLEDLPENSADNETDDDLEKEISEHENVFNKITKAPLDDSDSGELIVDENGNPIDTERVVNVTDIEAYVAVELDPSQQIIDRAKSLAEQGVISIPELERYVTKTKEFDHIPNPFGSGTLKDFMEIKPVDLTVESKKIKDQKTITDKTMLESTLLDFDRKYIENVLQKDTLNFICNIRNAGIIITDVKVEKQEDILNSFYHYSVSVEVPGGKQTTLHMDIPIPDEYGVFLSGGVKYFLKKQHGDLPIRKVSKSRVSLTSYYSKLFIDVKQNVSLNYYNWVNNRIQEIGLDLADDRVTGMVASECFYHLQPLPRIYTSLSERFSELTLKLPHPEDSTKSVIVKLMLDFTKRTEIDVMAEALEKGIGKKSVLAGTFSYGKEQGLVFFDKDSKLILKGSELTVIDSLEESLNLPLEKAPNSVATVNIFGTSVPVVLMLGYKMGMAKLLKTLGASYRTVPSGKQLNLAKDELRVRFKNESWIFKKKNPSVELVLGGLAHLNRYLVNYNSDLFEKHDIYLNLLEELGAGVKVAREFRIIFTLFIDHITKELLIEMKEPTDLVLLILRAVEMLTEDYYPEDNDKGFMRIKGYERLAGTVYNQLIIAVREQERMLITSKPSLNLNPKAVKLAILTDSSKDTYSEINPINCLKQQDIVTYGGTGGRKTETMVKRTRKYNDTDKGVMSEANVDSGDVGINAYLSANPNFTSLRGTTKRFDSKTDSLTNLLSPSALMAPCSEQDDPKRISRFPLDESLVE